MKKIRNYLRIMSILFVLALLVWPGAALAQTSSITYTSADFGDVVVDTTAVKIVTVTYTGESEFWFDYRLESDFCGLETTGSRGKLDPTKPSTDIRVDWTPLEPGQCTADLQILDLGLRTVAAHVTVTGNGVIEVPQEEPAGMRSLLDSFDWWVEAGHIVGKGPGKSADNRLTAFRNMLVEAEELVSQARNAEAYDQLMAARKKIGEFITDSDGTTITASTASASNATSELEELIDGVLESLIQ
jgi:hypothetical protein